MRRLFAAILLLAALNGCSRPPDSPRRHDPTKDPREQDVLGDADGEFELAVRVLNGPHDPPDYSQAARWFRMAAEKGHPGAQAILGVMLHKGLGIPRNDEEARKWLDMAASQPSAEQDAYAVWRDYV